MTSTQLVPALVIPFVVWRIYVRVRRNIGRQLWRPGRLIASVIIFSVLASLVAVAARHVPTALGALAAGLMAGGGVAAVALKLTRFETMGAEKFYTPNTYIGVGVTLLLLGRIAYRIMIVADAVERPTPSQYLQNPVTLAIFGLSAGFYIAYALGVYRRGHALT